MAKIILDSKCHQAIRAEGTEHVHYNRNQGKWKGKRLTGLRNSIESLGHSFEIVDISQNDLGEASVLVIAGRSDAVPFLDHELNKIDSFSKSGGGILLMANHPMSFISPQNQVVDELDLPFSFLFREGKSNNIDLLPHEISEGCGELNIRRFCRLSVSADPLITVIAKHTDKRIGDFAIAIENGNDHSRLVVVGSSGHISSFDDSKTDLFSSASNERWTLNIIAWLLNT